MCEGDAQLFQDEVLGNQVVVCFSYEDTGISIAHVFLLVIIFLGLKEYIWLNEIIIQFRYVCDIFFICLWYIKDT